MSAAAEAVAPEVPFPKALKRFPRLRQSLLGSFDLCALEARLAQEYEYIGDLDDPDRLQWHTHPQARGTIFHRWAAKLLDLLAALDQDALADTVQCAYERCRARPNDDRDEGDTGPEYQEGNTCPVCRIGSLRRVPLTEEALDMLVETLRCADVPIEDIVRVPQRHVKDLEWVVCKFAREQRFTIASFVAAEERMSATLTYPNPFGGVVERELTGQIDAWFLEQLEDGSWHAIVNDWKDTWAIPGATTISTEGYWQQRFYAWLVMMNYPDVSKVTLREVYVRYRAGDSGRDNHREATISRDKLPLIERQLAVVAEAFDRAWESYEDWRALKAEHDGDDMPPEVAEQLGVLAKRMRVMFLPTPGGHCNYCPLPHRCPIVDDVRVHGTIRTLEDAKRIAGELAVIKRAAKHREQGLRGYLEHERSAPVDRATADDKVKLRTYTDKPGGLPEGVPLKQAKGRKAYALVEGTRRSRPDREEMEALMEDAKQGKPVDLDGLYREATSVTMRLVEERVPTDEAAVLSPDVEEALRHGLERLERMRAAS